MSAFTNFDQKTVRNSILLIVVSQIVAVTSQTIAFRYGLNRAFWIGIFVILILAMIFLVGQKTRRIRSFSDIAQRDFQVAYLKLEAEKTAAFGLIFAIGLFYQIGFDLDKTSTGGQALRWNAANQQIQLLMTDTFCSVIPARTDKCKKIKDDMSLLFVSLYSTQVKPTRDIAHDIIYTVENDLHIPANSDQARAFDPVLETLKSMDVSDGVLNMIAKCLPVMSVLFGCFAISSKIAVAKIDLDDREKKAAAAAKAAVAAAASSSSEN